MEERIETAPDTMANPPMTSWSFTPSQRAWIVAKRCFDIFGSLLGLILLSPLFILCAILTKCTSRGPVFFRQERLTKGKRVFRVYKFRSMRIDAPDVGAEGVSAKERKSMETKWGAFMRVTSLDEIPQLINILIGDMSFIGPRACMASTDDLTEARSSFTPDAYQVKAGLSGFAQIQIHRNHDIHLKAALDSYYVRHLSIWMDTKIFFLSFLILLGINRRDQGR